MKSLRERAMDLLARREHSREELYNKLIAKGFPEEDVVATLDQLAQEGLQDDVRFADSYVTRRIEAGFGPCRIAQELQERGVAAVLIDRLVWQSATDWLHLLRAVWQRKYRQAAEFGTTAYVAQLRFLMQRGFEPDSIHHVLQKNTIEES